MYSPPPDSGAIARPGPPDRAGVEQLDPQTWSAAIDRFCQVTRLCASLYDVRGERIAGPFPCTGVATYLQSQAFWGDERVGSRVEHTLAGRAIAERGRSSEKVGGVMRVDALPLLLGGEPVGAIVFGWVFDHFSSPLECERFAREHDLDGFKLWGAVRQERPTSAKNFEVAAELLETLATALLKQLGAIAKLHELARVREAFLASVSHELRTPLQSIKLRVEQLLRTQLDDPANVRRLLEAVSRSVVAETRLVEDLLDSARTTNGALRVNRVPLRLSSVIQEAIEASEPAASAKGLSLVPSVPPHFDAQVLGDPERLRQVLWNLISNAIKFTPENGTIQLVVRDFPREVEVRVIDSGIGIAPEFLAHLFEPFAQEQPLHARRSGLGLGLSIAQHIVSLHGGELSAQSEGPGRGATFTVILPKA